MIRGGYGKYIEQLLGKAVNSQYGIPASYNGKFTNKVTNGVATYTLSNPFPAVLAQPGTEQLLAGIDPHYKDPYVQEYNLTIERALGFKTGLRVSYDGNHGSQLGYYIDGNQVPPNTVGYTVAKASVPYPFMVLYQRKYKRSGQQLQCPHSVRQQALLLRSAIQ